jgi:hypothetical protein
MLPVEACRLPTRNNTGATQDQDSLVYLSIPMLLCCLNVHWFPTRRIDKMAIANCRALAISFLAGIPNPCYVPYIRSALIRRPVPDVTCWAGTRSCDGIIGLARWRGPSASKPCLSVHKRSTIKNFTSSFPNPGLTINKLIFDAGKRLPQNMRPVIYCTSIC